MSQEEDLGIYKLIVILAVGAILLLIFAYIDYKIGQFSGILAFILGPFFMIAGYKILKLIWPDL